MIRHIIMWDFKDGFTDEENKANAQEVKKRLEALAKTIPGIVSINVVTSVLPGSNRPLMLNSLFESEDALASYQIHPDHVSASGFVKSVTQNRSCIDYQE